MARLSLALKSSVIAQWCGRTLEVCWLIVAFLLPLAFVTPGYISSEAAIAFVEIPKTALLRIMGGVMLVVWALEWALTVRSSSLTGWRGAFGSVRAWVGQEPGRWVVLGVASLIAATLLSTIFSASHRTSLLGEIEAQDSFPLYSMAAYFILFLVIVTHLRTREQITRLMFVIVACGGLVGGLAILQQHDLTPFGWLKLSGTERATASMGNAIFAGTFLAMTIPIALGLAVLRAQQSWRDPLIPVCLVSLAVQLLAIAYTWARGPWIGLAVALLAFVVLGLFIATDKRSRRLVMILGMTLLVAILAISMAAALAPRPADREDNSALGRLRSIPEGLTTGLTGRTTLWISSAHLAVNRPWFEFEEPAPNALRRMFGYGPDLYRYTMLLESRPWGKDRRIWEADHAHNLFIHNLIELGFLGLLAWFFLVGALLVTGAWRLVRWRREGDSFRLLVLVTLLSTMIGWFVAQQAGLNRISDYTLFWVLLALFVVLPMAEAPPAERGASAPRRRQRARAAASEASYPWALRLGLLAGVAALAVGTVWVTKVETIDYFRAGTALAQAKEAGLRGDPYWTLNKLDRAVELAPHMGHYYGSMGQLAADLSRAADNDEAALRWAREAHEANLKGIEVDPLYWRTRLQAAWSAYSLAALTAGDEEEGPKWAEDALLYFEQVTRMAPQSWPGHEQLGTASLDLRQHEDALDALDRSIQLTENTRVGDISWHMRAIGLQRLGRDDEAVTALHQSVSLNHAGIFAGRSHRMLSQHYESAGEQYLANKHDLMANLRGE